LNITELSNFSTIYQRFSVKSALGAKQLDFRCFAKFSGFVLLRIADINSDSREQKI